MSEMCNRAVLITIYYTLINSPIAFCIVIYGATTKNCTVNKILILQKKSIRILVDLKFKDPVRDYFKQLVMFTDCSLYVFETVKCIKVFSCLVPKQTCALRTLKINFELNLIIWNFSKKT